MKIARLSVCAILFASAPMILCAQGWVAEVSITVIDGNENVPGIQSATASFSNTQHQILNTSNPYSFTMSGANPVGLAFSITALGVPLDGSEPVEGSVNIGILSTCVEYEKLQDQAGPGKIFVTVLVYPRTTITVAEAFECSTGRVVFQSNGCTDQTTWWIGQEGNLVLASETNNQFVVDIGLLESFGIDDLEKPIQLRASQYENTTSEIFSDQFSAPPPEVNFVKTPPTCHGGDDGEISITITPWQPQINKFIVGIYEQAAGGVALGGTKNILSNLNTFENLLAGDYWIEVTNDVGQYGHCGTTPRVNAGTLADPQAMSVSLSKSNFSGSNITCNGANDGTIEAVVSNANLPIKTYSWTGSGTANGATITGCRPAPEQYSVTVTDNKNCVASSGPAITLTQPAALAVSVQVTDATCGGTSTGSIVANPSGGVGGGNPGNYVYQWSNNQTTQSITGLPAASTYSVIVKDANATYNSGCFAEVKNIDVDEPPAITFSINDFDKVDCPGTSTGGLEVQNVQHNQGNYSYLWSSGETTASIVNKCAKNYWLRVTDAQMCSTTVHKPLADAPVHTIQILPISNYNGSKISCHGDDDGALTTQLKDNNNNTVAGTNYSWIRNGAAYHDGSGLSQLDGLIAGTYGVVATYGQNCTVETSYILSQPSPVTIDLEPSDYNGFHIKCPGDANGSLLATASGGTPGAYTYQWQGGPATSTYSELNAGEYSVSAYDVNGCDATADFELLDPEPLLPSITITSDYHNLPISCSGESDGILTASTSGGASPYSYKWSHGDVGTVASNLSAGSYSVEAKDANGCTANSPVTEIIDPEPVKAQVEILSDYNGQAIRCFDGADGRVMAVAEGGTNSYTYLWSTNASTAELNGLSHGIYSVVVTDENYCATFADVDLVNPEPVIVEVIGHSDYNGFGVQCHNSHNGFIDVQAKGGTKDFTFNWPALNETTAHVEDLPAETFFVNVVDSNGCPAETSFEVTAPPTLTLEEHDRKNITCFDGSDGTLTVVSEGGAGGNHYALNNGALQESPEFTSLSADVLYIITVIDKNQCTETYETELTQPEKIKIEFTVEPAYCADAIGEASASVTGGVGNFTYQWTDKFGDAISSLPYISKQPEGIYNLIVHDDDDCAMDKSVGIGTVDGPAIQVAETARTSCFDSADGYARIEIMAGKGPFEVLWQNKATGLEVSNLTEGIHYVAVTDANNCSGVFPVVMKSPEPVSASVIQQKDVSCFENCDGMIEVSATGGNGGYMFEWNNLPGTSLLNNVCAGVYTVGVRDQLGCAGQQVFNVTEPEPLSLTISNRTLPRCNSGCDGSMEVMATGGTASYSYVWSSGSQTQMQENICAGDYLVTAKDAMNCLVSKTFSLGEPPKLSVKLVENAPPDCHDRCNGVVAVVALGGAGDYTFTWNDKISLARNTTLCPGNHTVVATDKNNCSISETYSVPNVPKLEVDLGGGVVVCAGQEHELDAGEGWKRVEWKTSKKWISSAQKIKISQPGEYTLFAYNANNCEATESFVLETSANLLEANVILAAEAHVGDTIVMVDISWPLPDQVTWDFPEQMIRIRDAGDVVHGKFENAGVYEVTLHAALGKCHDEASKSITILDAERPAGGGRLGADEFVKAFTLHPNPNNGTFEVEVEFIEKSPVTITIWNLVNSTLVGKASDAGSAHYKRQFNLEPITSGVYVLRLDFDGGTRTIRFLVH